MSAEPPQPEPHPHLRALPQTEPQQRTANPLRVADRAMERLAATERELLMTQAYADGLADENAELRETVIKLQDELIAATAGVEPITESDQDEATPRP